MSDSGQQQAQIITLERIVSVRTGLAKTDMDTVKLTINSHHFVVSLEELGDIADTLLGFYANVGQMRAFAEKGPPPAA